MSQGHIYKSSSIINIRIKGCVFDLSRPYLSYSTWSYHPINSIRLFGFQENPKSFLAFWFSWVAGFFLVSVLNSYTFLSSWFGFFLVFLNYYTFLVSWIFWISAFHLNSLRYNRFFAFLDTSLSSWFPWFPWFLWLFCVFGFLISSWSSWIVRIFWFHDFLDSSWFSRIPPAFWPLGFLWFLTFFDFLTSPLLHPGLWHVVLSLLLHWVCPDLRFYKDKRGTPMTLNEIVWLVIVQNILHIQVSSQQSSWICTKVARVAEMSRGCKLIKNKNANTSFFTNLVQRRSPPSPQIDLWSVQQHIGLSLSYFLWTGCRMIILFVILFRSPTFCNDLLPLIERTIRLVY